MSTLSDIGWWFEYLPVVIDDVSTANTIDHARDLKNAWKSIMLIHGRLGVRHASEACDVLDKFLESYPDLNPDPEGTILLPEVQYLLGCAIAMIVASGFDGHCIKGVRSLLKGLKKWSFDERGQIPDTRDACATSGFVSRQSHTGKGLDALDPRVAETAKQLLREVFPEPRWRAALNRVSGRTGPGAVYEKMSASKRWLLILSEIRKAIWPRGVIPPLTTSESWGSSSTLGELCNLSQHTCRLTAVSKDMWKKRLISIEQAFATYVQHWCRNALLLCMRCAKSVKHLLCGIEEWTAEGPTIDAQVIQQRLALEGSKSSWCDSIDTANRRPATLDFSDASDWVSWSQVYELLPVWVGELLQQCRSAVAEYGDVKNPDRVVLTTYAGMGNATTFTIETLVFWAVTEACRRVIGMPGKISVYGDDVILPTGLVHAGESFVLNQYAALNWRVNSQKSFYARYGRFRESCGVQAFQGLDVTYVSFPGYDPADVKSLCGLRDKVKQIATSFPKLSNLLIAEGLLQNFSGAPIGGAGCVDIPWLNRTPKPRSRFNRELCRLEYYVQSAACVRERGSNSGRALLFAWWSNASSRQGQRRPLEEVCEDDPELDLSDREIREATEHRRVNAVDEGKSYTVWRTERHPFRCEVERVFRDGAVRIIEPPFGPLVDEFGMFEKFAQPERRAIGEEFKSHQAVTMDPLPRRMARANEWLPTTKWGLD